MSARTLRPRSGRSDAAEIKPVLHVTLSSYRSMPCSTSSSPDAQLLLSSWALAIPDPHDGSDMEYVHIDRNVERRSMFQALKRIRYTRRRSART